MVWERYARLHFLSFGESSHRSDGPSEARTGTRKIRGEPKEGSRSFTSFSSVAVLGADGRVHRSYLLYVGYSNEGLFDF